LLISHCNDDQEAKGDGEERKGSVQGQVPFHSILLSGGRKDKSQNGEPKEQGKAGEKQDSELV